MYIDICMSIYLVFTSYNFCRIFLVKKVQSRNLKTKKNRSKEKTKLQ